MKHDSVIDKVKGMFLGIAIGDALGRAVETFTPERIQEWLLEKGVDSGIVDQYYRPDGHKWFDGQEAGGITDDTMLSMAVAEALANRGLSMDEQAKTHVKYYQENTDVGYGNSTRDSLRAIMNGSNWRKSATGTGVGNGIPMKIAPVAAHSKIVVPTGLQKKEWFEYHERYAQFLVALSGMTHKTDLSVSAAFAQYTAVYECLSRTPDEFNEDRFVKAVSSAAKSTHLYLKDGKSGFREVEEKLDVRLAKLSEYKEMTQEQLVKELDGGSCFVYNSLPFTYAFFLKSPQSIDSLYQVVTAGGDADTNASMLGACLGALHGTSIWPEHLIDGLLEKDRIQTLSEDFIKGCYDEKDELGRRSKS